MRFPLGYMTFRMEISHWPFRARKPLHRRDARSKKLSRPDSQLTTTLDVRVCKTAEDRVLLLLHGKLNGLEVSSNKRRPNAI